MATVICFSHYFVNKQNVRSYANIIKSSVLKSEDRKLFCKLLFERDMVSELSKEFIKIIAELKRNLKVACKDDFAQYFTKDHITNLHQVDKEFIFNQCCIALNVIIPRQLFGSSNNNKIFKKLVRRIIFSMKRQHLILEDYLTKWDFSIMPWSTLPEACQEKILNETIIGIMKYLLAPIICLNFYVTTCKLNSDENRLYYFWKNQWQSFYDKEIYGMQFRKIIRKMDAYSLGKVMKKQCSYNKKVKLKRSLKDIPILYLILKANNDFRPIVCYKNSSQNVLEKHKIRERLRFLRLLIGKPHMKIETQYENLHSNWLKANRPPLYFIKSDLSNAFGCVNGKKLSQIITERYMAVLNAENCANNKKKVAQQYKDLISELSKPFLIRAGSTIYKWREGLVQGYKYSPALSELYYMSLDEQYFTQHMKTNPSHLKLFIRIVDDYLYITDCLEDAHSFLKALSNYKNVNYAKTVINFEHETVKYSEEISFLGYHYNTKNLQVSRASNIFSGQMCYKITFTSGILDMYKFIASRVGQSGIQINSHVFNLQYNNEDLIWRHVFITYCLSANKFCTILAVLCSEVQMKTFMTLYKQKVTVKLTNCILDMLKRNKPKDFLFMYCINHFRYLSWKALYLVARSTPKCIGLVPLINDELAKTNCIFGKWREHASRIDVNGEPQHNSVRDVCRRTDLRKVFKDFDILPTGFECYHHKKLN